MTEFNDVLKAFEYAIQATIETNQQKGGHEASAEDFVESLIVAPVIQKTDEQILNKLVEHCQCSSSNELINTMRVFNLSGTVGWDLDCRPYFTDDIHNLENLYVTNIIEQSQLVRQYLGYQKKGLVFGSTENGDWLFIADDPYPDDMTVAIISHETGELICTVAATLVDFLEISALLVAAYMEEIARKNRTNTYWKEDIFNTVWTNKISKTWLSVAIQNRGRPI